MLDKTYDCGDTDFAPAGRLPRELVEEQVKLLASSEMFKEAMDAVPDIILVLNTCRQAVFANKVICALLNGKDKKEVFGFRPGEIFGCQNAERGKSGCGTADFCRECGAVQAIMTAFSGISEMKECRISRLNTNEALDVRVLATPFKYGGQEFVICAISDISHEKRRRVLERIFFHDILNTAGGIESLLSIITEDSCNEEEKQMLLTSVKDASRNLMDEIDAQKQLLAAENNELCSSKALLESRFMLMQLEQFYKRHEIAVNKKIIISPSAESVHFYSDPTILKRILGNMVKNALESSLREEEIILDCRRSYMSASLIFSVHNKAVIPEEVKRQIFCRSFSTKGVGRGLGTYSMKLLGEHYLNGKVSMESESGKGTTFSIALPLESL